MEDNEKVAEQSKQKHAVIASCIIGIVIVMGAVAYTARSSNSSSSTTSISITQDELSAYNGKNGANCYVAVQGTIYEIKQGKKWKDGEHITSEGRAYCGRDLSDVISKSPHGKSILEILSEVGKLK